LLNGPAPEAVNNTYIDRGRPGGLWTHLICAKHRAGLIVTTEGWYSHVSIHSQAPPSRGYTSLGDPGNGPPPTSPAGALRCQSFSHADAIARDELVVGTLIVDTLHSATCRLRPLSPATLTMRRTPVFQQPSAYTFRASSAQSGQARHSIRSAIHPPLSGTVFIPTTSQDGGVLPTKPLAAICVCMSL
jgi:hypothetical protein